MIVIKHLAPTAAQYAKLIFMEQGMKLLLTVNAGSSSVRLAAFAADFDDDAAPLASAHHETPDRTDGARLLRDFVGRLPPGAHWTVAHRIVHGGPHLSAPCRIDDDVECEIERLASLAPLHNPAALAWIGHCRAVLGESACQIAVFDTGFFADLPAAARTYALPHALVDAHHLRRYGFHGLAHSALWHSWCGIHGTKTGRVVTMQLGSGCSMAAIADGRPLDTSMGFSPLEGLVMGTRAGDVDAGVLTYLLGVVGMPVDELEAMLSRSSGLLGISGIAADMRALLASEAPSARLAVDVFCHRARKYLGAYLAVLGSADAVLIGGGIGENAPAIRARLLSDFEWAGLVLDEAANEAASGPVSRISSTSSTIAAHVIAVDEAHALARAALLFDAVAA
ncbi:MAG: acetate/propionate family kinase [Gammaproteobacteria bacterium]